MQHHLSLLDCGLHCQCDRYRVCDRPSLGGDCYRGGAGRRAGIGNCVLLHTASASAAATHHSEHDGNPKDAEDRLQKFPLACPAEAEQRQTQQEGATEADTHA